MKKPEALKASKVSRLVVLLVQLTDIRGSMSARVIPLRVKRSIPVAAKSNRSMSICQALNFVIFMSPCTKCWVCKAKILLNKPLNRGEIKIKNMLFLLWRIFMGVTGGPVSGR